MECPSPGRGASSARKVSVVLLHGHEVAVPEAMRALFRSRIEIEHSTPSSGMRHVHVQK